MLGAELTFPEYMNISFFLFSNLLSLCKFFCFASKTKLDVYERVRLHSCPMT